MVGSRDQCAPRWVSPAPALGWTQHYRPKGTAAGVWKAKLRKQLFRSPKGVTSLRVTLNHLLYLRYSIFLSKKPRTKLHTYQVLSTIDAPYQKRQWTAIARRQPMRHDSFRESPANTRKTQHQAHTLDQLDFWSNYHLYIYYLQRAKNVSPYKWLEAGISVIHGGPTKFRA